MILFRLFFIAILSTAAPAHAVEPTVVDFGAKKQNEQALIDKLHTMFERRVVPSARQPLDKIEFSEVQVALEDRRLTAASYDALVDFYFKGRTRSDTEMNDRLERLLIAHAESGYVPSSTLESIFRRTPDGQLTEVVEVALRNNPALRTPELNTTIHREFARVISSASQPEILVPHLFSTLDPLALKDMPETREKLKTFALGKSGYAYSTMMEVNPRLIPQLGTSFPVPSHEDVQAWANRRVVKGAPVSSGRTVDFDPASQRKALATIAEVHQSVFDGSKDRIRQLFGQSVSVVEAGMRETEILSALDVLADVDHTEFVGDLQKLAVNPSYRDVPRLRMIRMLDKSVAAHPQLRLTIIQAANLLQRPPEWVVRVVTELAETKNLSATELAALKEFLAHPGMLTDGNVQQRLIQLRRLSMHSVPSASCATAFQSLKP